jgi:REP element-mobilizing transposase RayT
MARILVHVVFSTKDRTPWLQEHLRPGLFAYMAGIVSRLGAEALTINGVADHVHVLLAMPTNLTLADLMRTVKTKSSRWVRDGHSHFAWQSGYAAFSVSESNVEKVRQYIEKQEEHHTRSDFKRELVSFLKRHNLEYDERYLWG